MSLRFVLHACLFALLPATAATASPPGAPSEGSSTPACSPCPHAIDRRETRSRASPYPDCATTPNQRPGNAHSTSTRLPAGAGTFMVEAGAGTREVEVEVHYYRPHALREHAPVLVVLPGAGRNAWDYRDHWIDAAERFGILVLSPHYPEDRYPGFWSYNLAGMLADVVIDREARALVDYRITTDRRQWLFGDMDRIFEQAVRAAGLCTSRYDLFGHSAGGQFLHRFALFAGAGTRADRILASNSGWYTAPDRDARFPFGLADAPIDEPQLALAFTRRLVVFLGGTDDANETRGDLVRSPETDRQGLHRLARGQSFHAQAARLATSDGFAFNWSLVVVPGIGHDPRRMSEAAAAYLYGGGTDTPASADSKRSDRDAR